MPNWCAGNIRFRGKKEDIVKLLENEVEYCKVGERFDDVITYPVVVRSDDEDLTIYPPKDVNLDKPGWYHIKGTRRAFLDPESISDCLYSTCLYELEPEFGKPAENNVVDAEPWLLIIDGFKQAWNIRAEEFTEMSTKYNVDIRIFAWEQGMQFERHVEILKGELITDITAHYDDWDWDCPLPWIGG